MLASSSVVVCDWCGDLFGIWLKLGVPLGIVFLVDSYCHHPPHCPPTTHLPFMSATPDITAVPVKASQNQAGLTFSDD